MNRAVWNAHSGSKKCHAGTLLLSFSSKIPQQWNFLSLDIHTTGAMWNLSRVGVFSLLQFPFYVSCNWGNRRFPVKIAYLSERKVKFFMKRVRENCLELHTGLHCGLWADASATFSSVQGVNSKPGMAVFAATVISGAVWVGTAALPHPPKLQWCCRLWEEMKFFQWSWTWSKRHL